MNRRGFIARTLTGAMSATVFTTVGWLMGTRTLTMPPPQCSGVDPCNGEPCGTLCWTYGHTCYDDGTCAPGLCKPFTTYGNGCVGAGCACICDIFGVPGSCGGSGCTAPCPPN